MYPRYYEKKYKCVREYVIVNGYHLKIQAKFSADNNHKLLILASRIIYCLCSYVTHFFDISLCIIARFYDKVPCVKVWLIGRLLRQIIDVYRKIVHLPMSSNTYPNDFCLLLYVLLYKCIFCYSYNHTLR